MQTKASRKGSRPAEVSSGVINGHNALEMRCPLFPPKADMDWNAGSPGIWLNSYPGLFVFNSNFLRMKQAHRSVPQACWRSDHPLPLVFAWIHRGHPDDLPRFA